MGACTKVEDTKLKDAVQTHGGKNWGAIAALVPGRTQNQCYNKWHHVLDPIINRTNRRMGPWTENEDVKLKHAIQTHGGKNWGAIAALVPGRSQKQCRKRWKDALDPSIDRLNERTGKWAEVEDIKLKDAVQTHGGKNWEEIAALVPGRTRVQCRSRWKDVDPNIDRANERTGKWTEDEDVKLKHAIQMHGGKNWGAIAALVPGRTLSQCWSRWHHVLDPSIDRANERTGKWGEDEDIKLKDAVQTHGDKDWVAISALVPCRTKIQCSARWKHVLAPSIDRTSGCVGEWTAVEDSKLKDAVQTHGKNWGAMVALFPGRTQRQCSNRWNAVLHPSIDWANISTGKWTGVEGSKLQDAVKRHGGKNWGAIAALVPGRTRKQCYNKWLDVQILGIL